MSPFQSVSTNLLDELKVFRDSASQQRARLEVSQLLCNDPFNVVICCIQFKEMFLNVPHFTRLQEIQSTVTDITKAREHMKQEQEDFSQMAAEMEQALKEAEALLL